MNPEILGFTASIIVVISFAMNGEKRIRIISIIAASIFVVYGIMLNAPSVWILNAIVPMIHMYKLYKLRKAKLIAQAIQRETTYDIN